MEHVDAVWDRMEFRTPWSRARELERVASRARALPGLAPRQPAHGGRDRAGVPRRARPARRASRSGLAGYADRLELDGDGRVVVVDLKTTAASPPTSRCATQPPARALPVRRRPRRCRRARGPADGPAEPAAPSWCSSACTDGAPGAVVQAQGVQADEGPERADLRAPAGRAAPLLRAEQFPAVVGPAVPRLPVRAHLPGQERRARGDASEWPCSAPGAGSGRRRSWPRRWASTGSPAPSSGRRSPRPWSPAVVIAGAGSGKTTLMAARVVYLVLTGQVRPDQVLGLTFTTKAASELREPDPRAPLTAAGALDEPGAPDADDVWSPPWRPTTPTPPPAHRARPADRARARHPGRSPTRRATSWARAWSTATRAGRPADRPRRDGDPEPPGPRLRDERAPRRPRARCWPSTTRSGPASCAPRRRSWPARPQDLPRAGRAAPSARSTGARELLGLVAAYRRLKADLGLMDFSDQIELGARLASSSPTSGPPSGRSSAWCCSTSTRTPRSPRR